MVRALSAEQPDEIPTFESWFAPPTADSVLGRQTVLCSLSRQYELLEKGLDDSFIRASVGDAIDFVKKLGWSAITLMTNPSKKSGRPTRIAENLWRVDDEDIYINPTTRFFSKKGTPIGVGGMSAFRDHVRSLEEEDYNVDLITLDLLRETVKSLRRDRMDVFVFYSDTAPFPVGVDWLPVLFKAMVTDPGLVMRYFDEVTKRAIARGEVAIDIGADGFLGGCDLAYKHGPMISPKQYHEFILPFMIKQSDAFHRKGAFMINRSDGNLWPIIDDYLINSRVDGMQEIEPTAGMDLGLLKEKFGDRRCFIGNVDCGNTLCFGTPEQVRRETLDCIRKAARGGGYVLGTSNSVHGGVRPELYLEMLETLQQYKEYGSPEMESLFV